MSELVASNRDGNRPESEGSVNRKTGAHGSWRAMLISLLTLLIVSMNGCGGSASKSKLVGKWKSKRAENPVTFELHSDGRAEYVRDGGNAWSVDKKNGTWTVSDDGGFVIEFGKRPHGDSLVDHSTRYYGSVKNDELDIFTPGEYDHSMYKRIP